MGWFNVIKGAYPDLTQIDRTLPANTATGAITRGSILLEDAGAFRICQAADQDTAYQAAFAALQGTDDLTAGMAGGVGQGNTVGAPVVTVTGGPTVLFPDGLTTLPSIPFSSKSYVVSGLSFAMPLECETDQVTPAGLTVGALVSFGNGGTVALAVAPNYAFGQVTKVPTSRWVNDATAITGFRTGGYSSVVRFRTLNVIA